jgi:hypothetical protein
MRHTICINTKKDPKGAGALGAFFILGYIRSDLLTYHIYGKGREEVETRRKFGIV